jgi:hypothetical protein
VTDDSVTVGAGQRVAVQLRIRRAAPSTPLVSPAESMRPSATPGVPILPTAPSTSDTPVVAPTGPPPPSQ